jgi:spoIIIJ-associated protein
VKDRIFEGADTAAALQRAAETLGVPVDELRHVVLDEREGRAQVAVLGVSTASQSVSTAPADHDRDDEGDYEEEDPVDGIRAIVAAISRAADIDVALDVDESEDRLLARLSGGDVDFFTADDGRVLTALEYLLQRTYGDEVQPRKILVDAGGYREQREAGLRRSATELAQAVRSDGETRATEPLNSYERRIVHMVVAALPGVSSRSEGQGSRRRVLIEAAGAL